MPDLTLDERKKMMKIVKGFCKECEKQNISQEDTEIMAVEVLRATAEELIKDRK